MRTKDIRGVNLGGWLVLERWITPSIFEGVDGPDEYSLVKELGRHEATRRLKKHRQTFITEDDVHQIKKLGLNTVRIPLGYWLFADAETFIGGSYRQLDQLFEWTAQYDLQVLLCLHGAPGSQNGWDHSGRAGAIQWPHSVENMTATITIIEQICRRYGQYPHLYGIELLNEPHYDVSLRYLLYYYRRAARIVRKYCHKGVRWVVSDAFRPRQMTRRIFLNWFRHPILDQHMYQLFTPSDRALTFEEHMEKAREWYHSLRWRARFLDVIIGEWSAVMDEYYQIDEQTKIKHFSNSQYIAYSKQQRDSFEKAGCGWIYWTAKVEDGCRWSLLDHPELLSNELEK